SPRCCAIPSSSRWTGENRRKSAGAHSEEAVMTADIRKDGVEAGGAWAQSTELTFRFLFIIVFVLAAGWAVSNFRQVPPDSRAIVLRFGTVVRESGAGFMAVWPRPFEQVMILPSADRQIEFKIGAFSGTASSVAGENGSTVNA